MPRQPHRILLYTGLATAALCLLGAVATRSSTLVLWCKPTTYLLLDRGAISFAAYHAGTLDVFPNGTPSNFKGAPPIWSTALPLWFLFLAAIAFSLFAWRWPTRPRGERCPRCNRLHSCPRCGYPAQDLPTCPECGTALNSPEPRATLQRRLTRLARPINLLLILSAAATLAIAIGTYRCRATPRLVWLTTHTYLVFKFNIAELALFHSAPAAGVQLDDRGVPKSFWTRPPIWNSQLPLWSLLAATSLLTITTWLKSRPRRPTLCAACKPTPEPRA